MKIGFIILASLLASATFAAKFNYHNDYEASASKLPFNKSYALKQNKKTPASKAATNKDGH